MNPNIMHNSCIAIIRFFQVDDILIETQSDFLILTKTFTFILTV